MSYFTVKLDGIDIHDPEYKEMTLVNATVDVALGEAGSFTFTICPDHVFYDSITPFGSSIEVFEDGTSIFYGRPLQPSVDMYGRKTYHCEGALAFLNDILCVPGTPGIDTAMSDQQYFCFLIDYYNSKVVPSRRLNRSEVHLQSINMQDPSWNFQSVKTIIQNEIMSYVGGYLYTQRRKGVTYLKWQSKSITTEGKQPLEIGLNILDVLAEGKTFYTAAYAKGAKSGDDYVTLYTPVVLSSDIVNEYGFMCCYLDYPNAENESELRACCRQFLTQQQFGIQSFDIGALDLHVVNKQYQQFILARGAAVKIPILDVDITLPITKISVSLNSGKKRISAGSIDYKSVTRQVEDVKRKEDKIEEKVPEIDRAIYDQDGNAYIPSIDSNGEVIATKIPKAITFTEVYQHVYAAGETLSISNYKVSAIYGDGTQEVITGNCTFTPANGYTFTASDNPESLRATYSVAGKTYKTSCILYSPDTMPSRISVAHFPDDMLYRVGEDVDFTGMRVVAYLPNGAQYSGEGLDANGAIPLEDLSCTPTTISQNSQTALWTDGNGINAQKIIVDTSMPTGMYRSTLVLGKNNGGKAITVCKPSPGASYLTMYKFRSDYWESLGANISGNNEVYLATQQDNGTWQFSGWSSARLPTNKFDTTGWWNRTLETTALNKLPISTRNPQYVSSGGLEQARETITISWARPIDGKVLTTELYVEITQ